MANGFISQFLTAEARFSKAFLTDDSVCRNKTESSQLLANFLQLSVQS